MIPTVTETSQFWTQLVNKTIGGLDYILDQFLLSEDEFQKKNSKTSEILILKAPHLFPIGPYLSTHFSVVTKALFSLFSACYGESIKLSAPIDKIYNLVEKMLLIDLEKVIEKDSFSEENSIPKVNRLQLGVFFHQTAFQILDYFLKLFPRPFLPYLPTINHFVASGSSRYRSYPLLKIFLYHFLKTYIQSFGIPVISILHDITPSILEDLANHSDNSIKIIAAQILDVSFTFLGPFLKTDLRAQIDSLLVQLSLLTILNPSVDEEQ